MGHDNRLLGHNLSCVFFGWPSQCFGIIGKITIIGKMSIIVGHLCPEKNNDNIVGAHERQ